MNLFDDVEKRAEPIYPGESHFDFLQRSDSDHAHLTRERIQSWLEAVQSDQRPRFAERIRSNNDEGHEAAIFELHVHAFLLERSCRIIEYEPLIDGRRPEYLIETAAGRRIILEASVIAAFSMMSQAQRQHQWIVHHALNECPPTSNYLALRFNGPFSETPSRARIKAQFLCWLRDPGRSDEVEIREAGATFTIRVIASAGKVRPGQAISLISGYGRGGMVAPQIDVRKKIKRKSQQLSGCDIPVVLALKLSSFWHSTDTMMAALFGDPQVQFRTDTGEVTNTTRDDESAFLYKRQPVNTSISGLLGFSNAEPWSAERTAIEYWQHLWAKHQWSGEELGTSRWVVDLATGKIEVIEQQS